MGVFLFSFAASRTSLHNCFQNPVPTWQGAPWFGHATLQQGHFMTSSVQHWLDLYNADPPRTLIEDEANYERLKYDNNR